MAAYWVCTFSVYTGTIKIGNSVSPCTAGSWYLICHVKDLVGIVGVVCAKSNFEFQRDDRLYISFIHITHVRAIFTIIKM